MAHNTEAGFSAAPGGELARLALAPVRAVDSFFHAIAAANRLAREYENLSLSSDRQLADLGLERGEVAQYVAKRSELFGS